MRRYHPTALLLAATLGVSSTAVAHARTTAATTISAHRALALCGHSHMHFKATVRGYVRTGGYSKNASFTAALFDSNRVPENAGTGNQFARFHGVRLYLPLAVVRHRPSALVSGTQLTVSGTIVCAGSQTTLHVRSIDAAAH